MGTGVRGWAMVLPTSPLMGSAPRFEYPKQGERRPLPRFARTHSAPTRLGSCFFRLRALIVCRLAPCAVWSPAGGWWCNPRHWKRNTAVAYGFIGVALAGTFMFSAANEVRPRSQHGLCAGELGGPRGGRDRGRRAGPGGGRAPGCALAIASRHTGGLSCRVDAPALRRAPGSALRSGDQCRRSSGSRHSRGPVTRKRTTPD